ncbi:MAG: fosfomycin resistance glutathione transferase [Granulosicoccaceae bacterium]
MITGLNHLTITVSDLERSLEFYVDVLGFKPEGRWDKGAYLSAEDLWLCLSLEPTSPAKDYTHYAFSIDENKFDEGVDRIKNAGAVCWKTNASEGSSYYFLDLDGHKLELHNGNLASRLESLRSNPYSGWTLLS